MLLKRAVLLLCLAVPLAAGAQTTEGVTISIRDTDGTLLTNTLGRIRCDGTAPGFDDPTISITWTLIPTTATTPAYAENDVYRIGATTQGACPATPTAGAGLIDTLPATTQGGSSPVTGTVLLSSVLAKVPVTCSGTADLTVRICVALVRGSSGNVDKTLQNTFTLQLAPPPPPTALSVSPGDHALNLGWTKGIVGTGQVETDRYRVTVTPRDSNEDAGGPRSTETAAVTFRQGGLVEGAVYDVSVVALSAGGNTSDALTGSGTPSPVNDFFEEYKEANGPEQGGCAGGPAGLLSLVALGAVVRAFRRRS